MLPDRAFPAKPIEDTRAKKNPWGTRGGKLMSKQA